MSDTFPDRLSVDPDSPHYNGNAKDRFGKPLTIKLKGKVEPYFKDQA